MRRPGQDLRDPYHAPGRLPCDARRALAGPLVFVSCALALLPACKEKPPGPQEMLWNGDRKSDAGKGWGSCDSPPKCKAEIALVEGKGYNGSLGLHFHGEGPGYQGAGWNWFGWWPEDAGKDLTPYNTLQFEMRVVVSEPKPPPEDLGLTINIATSTEKKKSTAVKLSKYVDENIADGKWHRVNIPLDDFYEGAQPFDRQKVWELALGSWLATPRTIDIYIDDIGAWEK